MPDKKLNQSLATDCPGTSELRERGEYGSGYNEIDPKKAAWLRELIVRGAIAPGVVDERSALPSTPNLADQHDPITKKEGKA